MLPFPRYVMRNQSLISIASEAYTNRRKSVQAQPSLLIFIVQIKSLYMPFKQPSTYSIFFVNMLAFYQSQLWKPIHFMKGKNQGNIIKAD
jgi:hypothetical protein